MNELERAKRELNIINDSFPADTESQGWENYWIWNKRRIEALERKIESLEIEETK